MTCNRPRACDACKPAGTAATIFDAFAGVVPDRKALAAGEGFAQVLACAHVTSCRDCEGRGMHYVVDDAGHGLMTRCHTSSRVVVQVRRINAAKVPAQYAGVYADFWRSRDEQQHARLGRMREWLRSLQDPDNRRRSVWIAGNPGTGKSSMSVIAAVSYAGLVVSPRDTALHRSVRWCDVPTLLRDCRASRRVRGSVDPMTEARDCGLLVLDDIDKVSISETPAGLLMNSYDDELVWQLLKHRSERGLATFVTSNIRIEDWLQRSRNGAALRSRIAEAFVAIGMPGRDHRV